MLRDPQAFSSFSVNDVPAAKEFYGNVLGLNAEETPEGLHLKFGGTSSVLLYPKPDHQPATFTVLNFRVDDMERIAGERKARGIPLEHYDLPDLKTNELGIFRVPGGPTIAWFKDPAGNILSVLEERKSR